MYPLLGLSRPETVSILHIEISAEITQKKPEILDLRDLFPYVFIFSLYAAVGASSPMGARRQFVEGPTGRICPKDSHEWRRRDAMNLVPYLFFLPSERFLHYLQQSRWFMGGRCIQFYRF